MSGTGNRIAARARALVGTRFRPQGRDPALGLDCVGVVAAAAGVPAESIRRNYAARGQSLAEIEHEMIRLGWRPAPPASSAAGDMIVCEAGPVQFHLLVSAGETFVHADAGLRRVVERPFPVPWPVLGIWRCTDREEE
jgi:hypothetical protein